jgi:SAM-dependent methyltransferase
VGRPLGLSFGSAVEDYVHGRPGYPAAAIEAPGVPADAHVLDLAAGTGKLTESLVQLFARVTAVEPDAEMRAANHWGEVFAGTAASIPLPDAAVDGVFVAEAFHWFGGPEALREIERVLRPRGALVLLWNHTREGVAEPLPGVHELMESLKEEPEGRLKHRWFGSGEWRSSFEGSSFGTLEEADFEHDQVLDSSALVSYFCSQSKVASRPPAERAAIRAELERLIPDGPHVRPLRANVVWTRLR